MPQASPALRKKFPGSDAQALKVLQANFVDQKGVIAPKRKGYTPTPRENDAIAYLFHEWDYAYKA